ncbi:MAG: hypothetical protein AAFS12_00155 [Cyanobacteria bacterium J06632_19]
MRERRSKNAKPNWLQQVVRFIRIGFTKLRQALTVLLEIALEILNTAVYLFSIALKFISAPSTPCLLAIAVFGFVLTATTAQWWSMGLWWGRLLGIRSFSYLWFQGLGGLGAFVGLCFNIFQLAPEMWRISRRFAQYYADREVDVNYESDEDQSVKNRLNNWLSEDHSTLKKYRKASFILEAILMIVYTLLGNLSFWGLVLGTASLIAPEQSIKLVSSTISLLGDASTHSSEQPPEQYEL